MQNLVKTDDRYQWRINLSAIDACLERLGDAPPIASLPVTGFPVLSIYGEQSGYMDASARKQMQSIFPGTEFAPVANAGHWVHAEQADAFQQALEGFLGQL